MNGMQEESQHIVTSGEVQQNAMVDSKPEAVDVQPDIAATPKKPTGADERGSDSPKPSETLQEPAKPKSAFFCFLDSARESISDELDSRSGPAVSKRASERWKSMSAEEKAPFESKAAELKEQYDTAFAAFLERGGTPRKRQRKVEEQKTETKEVAPVGPPQPLKPKTAFFFFLDSARAAIAEEVGSTKGNVVTKVGGQRWKDMNDEARAPFESQAAEVRRAYEKDMEAFLAEGGVLRKRKSKAQLDSDGATADGQAAEVETPKKRPRPAERARLSLPAKVVSIAGHGLVQGEERLLLRRDRRGHSSPTAIAVYDASLGGHVGYLDDDVAQNLAPLLDRLPALRVSGRVAAQAEGDGPDAETSATTQLRADVLISGPLELAAELEAFGEIFKAPVVSDGVGGNQKQDAASATLGGEQEESAGESGEPSTADPGVDSQDQVSSEHEGSSQDQRATDPTGEGSERVASEAVSASRGENDPQIGAQAATLAVA